MSTVYGATCFSRKNIYKWVKYSNTSPNSSPWVEARRLSSKKGVQVPAIHKKGDAHHFLGYARPNHHFISWEKKFCEQCQLLWTAETGQKRQKEQTQGSSVKRSHHASWKCKASHSSRNGADHQQPGMGAVPSSPLQPRPCPFRLLPVWSLERVHKRHKVWKWQWSQKCCEQLAETWV